MMDTPPQASEETKEYLRREIEMADNPNANTLHKRRIEYIRALCGKIDFSKIYPRSIQWVPGKEQYRKQWCFIILFGVWITSIGALALLLFIRSIGVVQ